jgi:hypothetical protein
MAVGVLGVGIAPAGVPASIGVSGVGSLGVSGTGEGRGVLGTGEIGVQGVGGTNGYGVEGMNNSADRFAHGVRGSALGGAGGEFIGARSALALSTISGVANPNVDGPVEGRLGDVYCGTVGSLWYRTSTANPNPYRRLADQNTAGALSLLAAPLRLVDTRSGSGFFDAGNPYSNGNTRGYDIATLSAGAVPAGTRAIVARAVAINGTVGGVLRASPVNPPGTGSAIINFAESEILGATFTSALDSSNQIFIQASIATGTVDFILDVIGYYL